MKKFKRLFISLMFAFLAAGVTLIVASAQTPQPGKTTTIMTNDNCIACHQDIATVWMTGLHGQAGTDPDLCRVLACPGQTWCLSRLSHDRI